MVAVRGCVSLAVAFLFLSCSVFFLGCRVGGLCEWVAGFVLGVCVRGSVSAGVESVVVPGAG